MHDPDPGSSASLRVATVIDSLRMATVTASLGPVGPLLRSLTPPPEGVSESEIQSLTRDLEGLCVSLMDHSEAEEPSSTAMSWMSEIRELCYDIKNYFDDAPFILKQHDHAQLTPEEKQENAQLEFMLLVDQAKHASERREMYDIELLNIKKAEFLSVGRRRRRLPALLIDPGLMDTLANKLMCTAEDKQLKVVVSLVGLEGVGKTTLTKRLYHQIGGQYQCRAFVRVSPNPDMRMLLTSIFKQIQLQGLSEPACCLDAQHLIKNIKHYLEDKRYLIIIDDLWSISVWDIIRRAFPDDVRGSRIITTTQSEDVAAACCSYNPEYICKMEPLKNDQSQNLLFSMIFGSEDHVGCPKGFTSVSLEIVRKCGGLPLLTVNVASLLPTPSDMHLQQWEAIRDSLPPTLMRNPSSEGIEEFINLMYTDLSPEVKTCLLYLAMYPEGYTVDKHDLVKQWVSEGFTGEGQNKEETALDYFDELVSRGLIQAVDINYGKVLSCTLHHMVHDLIVKKSMEGNFVIGVDYIQSAVWLPDKVRRLSVQFGGARSARLPAGINLSEVRSLAYFGFYGCADFIEKCKLLRVLTLHVWADDCVHQSEEEEEERPGISPSGEKEVLTYDLSGFSKLLPLRYLKVACNVAVKLPDDIEALQYLEKLEVDATIAAIPSGIGKLSRLSCLKIAVRELSAQDIRILQALQSLSALSLHVWTTSAEMIVFDKGEFLVLKYFKFRCSVPWLKFQAGSMPDLRNLNLCFNAGKADQHGTPTVSIEHLPGLKEITAEIWGADTFRTAISNHQSNPSIDVQLVDSRIFYGDTATSMSKNDDSGEEEKKQAADSSTSTLLGSSVPVQGASQKPTSKIETDSTDVKAQTFDYGPEFKVDDIEEDKPENFYSLEDMNIQTDTTSQLGWEAKKIQADFRISMSPGSSSCVPDPGTQAGREGSGQDGNTKADTRIRRPPESSHQPVPEIVARCREDRSEIISVPSESESTDGHTGQVKTRRFAGMEDANVLESILDGASAPTNLSLQLLKDITGNFSQDRKIGQGGFGEVYKGVLGERIVAVKRIYITENTVDDRLFHREFVSLWNTNHQNVVRFLGFCSSTQQKMIQDALSGEVILANILERLLCFEYISNGSLDRHITDELRGLEWETRYEIIIGICKGLRYLHNKKDIIHMDLKPANILLQYQDEKYLVPKITDFGLSRPNKNSYNVGRHFGTLGYLAPEYVINGEASFKCDIYSLGAIILELVTGCKGVPNKNNVLRRWRHRWNKPPTQLQYQQVTRCIYIAERCREQKPEARPSILEIISFLSESESTYSPIIPCLDEDNMLTIEPLELQLPSGLKNKISCLVELTNGTCNCIAFNIQLPSKRYSAQPIKGVVHPGSTYVVTIMVQERDVYEDNNAEKFIVQSKTVSNYPRDEDIEEGTFHAEADKVVDEVDLMVAYVSTKPQESRKRRKDTNTPAEEVPKMKQRKIVESGSKKGKNKLGSSENAEAASMDINSSTQGQYNLHPLQSFLRHYPTNRKYLGKESDRAVDHARGAMGSLLDKLGKLVTGDYSLDPSIKGDIKTFSLVLMKMHLDLPKLKNVARAKVFVDEVRELSYNIEDMVDSFQVQVEPNSNRSGFREIVHESVKLVQNGMMTHRQIGDVIRDIKANVQAVDKRKEKYNFGNATLVMQQLSSIYEDNEQLVGIKAPRDEVIRLLQEDGDASKQKLRVVSIVGMGGLGKTTLAKAVYDKLKTYHPKVFVPVGQNPDIETILKNIILTIENDFNAEKLIVWQLIEKLKELLENKRYFIVIDDIWDSSAWGVIKPAFPENNCGSRLVITTRIHDVALACCHPESKYIYMIKPLSSEESIELFFRRTFGPRKDFPVTQKKEEISYDILNRCGGMPLAINSMASLLAGKPETTWEYVRESMGALTEGNAALDDMKQILDLSYRHLPDYLKTCLMYVCKYPVDREIDKKDLLRQWVAEGFVSTNSGHDAMDVAEQYFKTLINMSMIQPGSIDYTNEVLSCRVHDIILEFMRSKSSEVNFIQVIDGSKYVSGVCGQIRRVSVHYNDEDDSNILATIKGSLEHVRSVLLYRRSLVPYFLDFKYVRVLHIERGRYLGGLLDLTGISRLFLLRYLKVALNDEELKLPDQIGQLQHLETMDLIGCVVKNYPSDIASLPQLLHLEYGKAGIALPEGIDRLKSLRTLEGVCVYKSSVDSIKGLSELTNLRKLQICSEEIIPLDKAYVYNTHMDTLHSSISKLSTSLSIFTFEEGPTIIEDVRAWSRTPFSVGHRIQELDLRCCNFQSCPEWIGQLHGLCSISLRVREVADGVSIVAWLPSLAYFYLIIEMGKEEKEESVVIPGGGAFRALKHLSFNCQKALLNFEEGAMPKLEKLDLLFPYRMTPQFVPVGIEYLPADTLKEICLSVERNLRKLKGCKDWDDEYYYSSPEYKDKLREHTRKLRAMLTRAFEPHHPGTDIIIDFAEVLYDEEDYEEDDVNQDYVSSDDDQDYEEDDEGASRTPGFSAKWLDKKIKKMLLDPSAFSATGVHEEEDYYIGNDEATNANSKS